MMLLSSAQIMLQEHIFITRIFLKYILNDLNSFEEKRHSNVAFFFAKNCDTISKVSLKILLVKYYTIVLYFVKSPSDIKFSWNKKVLPMIL